SFACCLVFFFQAEDGIRVFHVTGVQTCALPISMQLVNADLAKKAGVEVPQHSWDRHHYEAMLPGFGGSDSMDWRGFVDLLTEKGFDGPFEIENEAKNSKETANLAAISQGYVAAISFLKPMLWDITETDGYSFTNHRPLSQSNRSDVPVVSVKDLL